MEFEGYSSSQIKEAMDRFYVEHERICLDCEARNLRHTYVTPSEDQKIWVVQQMIIDPDHQNDWVAEFQADLIKSREEGKPVMRLVRFGPLAT